jgi:hypothetical protein
MPSAAYRTWRTVRAVALDDVEAAHTAVRGAAPVRQLARLQLNRAYVLLLSAEFQGFCRDLHTEASDHILVQVPGPIRGVVQIQFLFNRALDRGNPSPGNLGNDFGRFDLSFWPALTTLDGRTPDRRRLLDEMNDWRNAIAHHDYDAGRLGGTLSLRLSQVRRWRRNCDRLGRLFEAVLADRLRVITGHTPW